jgi:hypothetical protein
LALSYHRNDLLLILLPTPMMLPPMMVGASCMAPGGRSPLSTLGALGSVDELESAGTVEKAPEEVALPNELEALELPKLEAPKPD